MERGEPCAFYLSRFLPQTLYLKYYRFIAYLFDNESDYRIHYWINCISC